MGIYRYLTDITVATYIDLVIWVLHFLIPIYQKTTYAVYLTFHNCLKCFFFLYIQATCKVLKYAVDRRKCLAHDFTIHWQLSKSIHRHSLKVIGKHVGCFQPLLDLQRSGNKIFNRRFYGLMFCIIGSGWIFMFCLNSTNCYLNLVIILQCCFFFFRKFRIRKWMIKSLIYVDMICIISVYTHLVIIY